MTRDQARALGPFAVVFTIVGLAAFVVGLFASAEARWLANGLGCGLFAAALTIGVALLLRWDPTS